jgi:hypothetical protein
MNTEKIIFLRTDILLKEKKLQVKVEGGREGTNDQIRLCFYRIGVRALVYNLGSIY